MRPVEEILEEIDRLLGGYKKIGGFPAEQRAHSLTILKEFILSGTPKSEPEKPDLESGKCDHHVSKWTFWIEGEYEPFRIENGKRSGCYILGKCKCGVDKV